MELSIALTVNERTRPILDGAVTADGIRFVPTALTPGEIFWRQLKYAEFDVSEMSLGSFTIATAKGETRWVGIPVFPVRAFFHTGILVRKAAGIAKPEDLRGKRVGVPEYQQTAVVWTRGILQHEFGVDPRELEWFMERTPERSHGSSTGFTPPPGIRFSYVPAQTDLAAMLLGGELDAILFYVGRGSMLNRSRMDLRARPEVATLFPDPAAEARRFYAARRLFPINHCVVVRRTLVEREPGLAARVFALFGAAKDELARRLAESLEPYAETGLVASDALASDPMPYGLAGARLEVETVAAYLEEQGLAPRRVAAEELFPLAALEGKEVPLKSAAQGRSA